METIEQFTPDVIQRLMLQVSFFHQFSDKEKDIILSYMQTFYRFHAGEKILCAQAEDDQAMYVLLSGRAVITSGENNTWLDDVHPGDFFGEVSFLTDLPRTANVLAEEACIVWRIDHQLLLDVPDSLRENIKDQVIDRMARVIAHSNQQISQKFI